jgi:hypothetical protein
MSIIEAVAVGAENQPSYATWGYWWIRPPSRSPRMTLISVSMESESARVPDGSSRWEEVDGEDFCGLGVEELAPARL